MALLNDIPIYRATVNGEEDVMFCISLVDYPATESNFLAFDKEKQVIKFSIENEEKRIVRGLIMGADMPIYRRKGDFEYFIVFDAETIRLMAEKYFKYGFQNNVDTNHNEQLVNGVNLVQMFIKDSENGVSPKGFEDYKDGSLFAEFHVENDEIWNAIKDGTYRGFSLAGVFDIEEIDEEEQDFNECLQLINKINKIINP